MERVAGKFFYDVQNRAVLLDVGTKVKDQYIFAARVDHCVHLVGFTEDQLSSLVEWGQWEISDMEAMSLWLDHYQIDTGSMVRTRRPGKSQDVTPPWIPPMEEFANLDCEVAGFMADKPAVLIQHPVSEERCFYPFQLLLPSAFAVPNLREHYGKTAWFFDEDEGWVKGKLAGKTSESTLPWIDDQGRFYQDAKVLASS